MMNAPMAAPRICPTMYAGTSLPSVRFSAHMPIVTAGLMWHPEM